MHKIKLSRQPSIPVFPKIHNKKGRRSLRLTPVLPCPGLLKFPDYHTGLRTDSCAKILSICPKMRDMYGIFSIYSSDRIASILLLTRSTSFGDCLMSTSDERLRKNPQAASSDSSLYSVAVTRHPSPSFSMLPTDDG